jgi:cell division protease FtsH
VNDVVKNLVLWVVIAVVLLSVFHSFGERTGSAQSLIYSDFLTQVKQGQVREVTIEGQNISGKMISGTPFTTYSPETNNSALIGDLERSNVSVMGKPPEPP